MPITKIPVIIKHFALGRHFETTHHNLATAKSLKRLLRRFHGCDYRVTLCFPSWPQAATLGVREHVEGGWELGVRSGFGVEIVHSQTTRRTDA